MKDSVAIGILLYTCFFFFRGHVSAQRPTRPTASEAQVLPEYCRVRYDDKRSSPEWRKWRSVFGSTFEAMHHYCNGLNDLNLVVKTSDDSQQRYLVGRAIGQFYYMVEHAASDWILWPECYVKLGNSRMLQGRGGEAAAEYLKAIKIKPGYTPPYIYLSDYYLEIGSTEEARQVLEEGIKHAPNSKLLRKKLEEVENWQ